MSRIDVASKPPLAKRRADMARSLSRDMMHCSNQTLVW
jgi:hypothetical protein